MSFPLNVLMQKKMDFMFQEPDPPHAFTWLYDGVSYPVYNERRGKNQYWYMSKMINGTQYRLYMAPAGKLEAGILDSAAMQIAANASPV